MPKIAPNSPLYAQFRQDFPAQAGEGITSDLNYSDTIVPIVDMTDAAGEGTLPTYLQTATDFATDLVEVGTSASSTFITTPGFWNVDIIASITGSSTNSSVSVKITDGVTTKTIFKMRGIGAGSTDSEYILEADKVVFVRAGDSVRVDMGSTSCRANITYRQVATVNGELINPLGFSFL